MDGCNLKTHVRTKSFMGSTMEAELRICKLSAESDSEALVKLYKEDPDCYLFSGPCTNRKARK